MFNLENAKKLIKLGYLINTGTAGLQFLIVLLNSFDVIEYTVLALFSGFASLLALAGSAAVFGGFVLAWYFDRNIFNLAIPGVYVLNFCIGFVLGFANMLTVLSIIITIVALSEYAVWAFMIKDKNRLFAMGLMAVCGFGFVMAMLGNSSGGGDVITIFNSLASCAGMGLCFLSSLQMD